MVVTTVVDAIFEFRASNSSYLSLTKEESSVPSWIQICREGMEKESYVFSFSISIRLTG